MFGFECLPRNKTEQLVINTLNEQVQFLYNQRMFVWEMLEHVSFIVAETNMNKYLRFLFLGRRTDSSDLFSFLR